MVVKNHLLRMREFGLMGVNAQQKTLSTGVKA